MLGILIQLVHECSWRHGSWECGREVAPLYESEEIRHFVVLESLRPARRSHDDIVIHGLNIRNELAPFDDRHGYLMDGGSSRIAAHRIADPVPEGDFVRTLYKITRLLEFN